MHPDFVICCLLSRTLKASIELETGANEFFTLKIISSGKMLIFYKTSSCLSSSSSTLFLLFVFATSFLPSIEAAPTVATCGWPPSIKGGRVVWQNYTSTLLSRSGDYIRYWCENGIKPDIDWVICLDNGTWSLPLPQCESVTCPRPHPGMLLNGRILVSTIDPLKESAAIGDRVTFICDSSFILVGISNTIECLEVGQWSKLPECVLASPSCGIPPKVLNGREITRTFTTPEGQAGNRVRFECMTGFNSVGRTTITCLPNGQWSQSPRCVPDLSGLGIAGLFANSCGSPLPVTNGFLQGKSYRQDQFSAGGDTLSYACNPNFVMNGSSIVTCNADTLLWSKLPTCIRKFFILIEILDNFFIIYSQGLWTCSKCAQY